MRIRLGVVLVVPLLALAASCGDSGSTGADVGRTVPDLDGTSWIATTITEQGKPHALVAGSELRVDFTDGNISINAGCNALGGSYSLSEDAELSAGTLAGTEIGCAQPLMDQDTWLSGTVFAKPLLASVDDGVLTLSREGLELVLADRATVSPDVLLEGTSWQLDGIQSGETVSSLPAGAHVPTFSLAGDGTVALDTGCNSAGATATVDGAHITFGPVMATKRACADAAGRQIEAAVLAVLAGEADWSISEKTLTITKGDQGLVFRAVP